MPHIIEITEATDKEMLKKLMAFLHIKSLIELKKHTLQQIIGMLHRKEETTQKELQAKRQEFLAKLSTMTQKEWEELIEKKLKILTKLLPVFWLFLRRSKKKQSKLSIRLISLLPWVQPINLLKANVMKILKN
ncbi:hypothetical protein [Rickettsiella massiliensis]|uniref:hypothetical protein n=1 Tax=Rickettsiella massiliensis TaxID=676517 RepID=UPI00029B3A3C|nr:hypothetical protein [Rickettsiella massiliensis]